MPWTTPSSAPPCASALIFGVAVAATTAAFDEAGALSAAAAIGYPVVLKTDRSDIAHKSDVGGVAVGLEDPAALSAAYRHMAALLGGGVVVMAMAAAGVELAIGIVRDPLVGPVVVVGAGGVLVEILADRVVGLPPLDAVEAGRMLRGLGVHALMAGARGARLPTLTLSPAQWRQSQRSPSSSGT